MIGNDRAKLVPVKVVRRYVLNLLVGERRHLNHRRGLMFFTESQVNRLGLVVYGSTLYHPVKFSRNILPVLSGTRINC